jgi:hypothetical protein
MSLLNQTYEPATDRKRPDADHAAIFGRACMFNPLANVPQFAYRMLND